MALEKRDGAWLIAHERASAKRRPAAANPPDTKPK